MDAKQYPFNGNNITFSIGNDTVMVNATEMAKPFGKRVQHFLSTTQTAEYIEALSQSRNLGFDQLVQIQRGGNNPGTWMHEDVALEFARWLSPAFAIWCNDRIKELLRHGITATQPTIENILNDPDTAIKLLTELKKERAEKEALLLTNQKLQIRSDFVDRVFSNTDLVTMSQAAKLLKLPYGRNKMLRKLRENKVLFANSNEPYQHLVDKGYFVMKEKEVPRANHPPKIVMTTYPTQKGLAYIAKVLGVVVAAPDKRIPVTT